MNLLDIIFLGRRYLKLWPEKTELLNFFAEYRQVLIGRMVCRYSAHFAALIFALPFALPLPVDSDYFIQNTLVVSLFILSLPVQVYIILGLQADKYLPPSLAKWYKEGISNIDQNNTAVKLTTGKPKYFDLVQLLNLSHH
jgi:uncharacterized membrane protein YfbV (UPF0208 family)